MVRRIASQVHKQVARLARKNFFDEEPLWYRAVLEHPPIPLPSKAPPNRLPLDGLPYDLPTEQKIITNKALRKSAKIKSAPIVYLEDEVRRQFFRDHPFEAFRERTLTESGAIEDEHPIRGKQWTRLSQRGRNPTPEDVVRFAVSLHEYHGKSLSDAYTAAVMQYRALRSEHHIATLAAIAEAEWFGGVFQPSEIDKGFEREEKYLESWETRKRTEQESLEARKRWKSRIEPNGHKYRWTGGEEYVRLWKDGIRPDYSPALSPDSVELVQVQTQTPKV